MYPRPDFSTSKPEKDEDDYSRELAWGEGQFSDGRPYRVDFWCEDQISYLIYYFSTLGLETATQEDLRNYIVGGGVLSFRTDVEWIHGVPANDRSGHAMWSVTVVVGDENETYIDEKTPLQRYR